MVVQGGQDSSDLAVGSDSVKGVMLLIRIHIVLILLI